MHLGFLKTFGVRHAPLQVQVQVPELTGPGNHVPQYILTKIASPKGYFFCGLLIGVVFCGFGTEAMEGGDEV
jgi:hypothetical protein